MHSIPSQTLKWSLIGITLIAVVLVSVSAFANGKKPERYDAGWNPESISESLQSGQSLEIPLTYVPNENIFDVSIIVSPEIAPYVTVEPETIEKAKKGEPISLIATINVPITAIPEVHSGLIHLIEEKEKKKYRSYQTKWEDFWAAHRKYKNREHGKPLSLSLEVLWPKAENLPGVVNLEYTTFGQQWTFISNTDVIDLGVVGVYAIGHDEGPGSVLNTQYGITITKNSTPVDPDMWFQQNIDPNSTLIGNGTFERRVLDNGMVAFFYVGQGEIPGDYDPVSALYAISPSGRTVVVIDLGDDNSLSEIGVTYASLIQAFLSIASSVNVIE